MNEKAEGLKNRTKNFALRVIHLVRKMPRNEESRILGRQLLRAATGVAANYRAVCRARSGAEFLAKMGVVVEEADETVFWLNLMGEAGTLSVEGVREMHREAMELLAIFAASQCTARRRRPTSRG